MANKIVIHTLQFMKLYLLHIIHNSASLPKIDKKFVVECMKTPCTISAHGPKPKEETAALQAKLKKFFRTY